MSAARQLILENQLGQRVRTFAVQGSEMSLIYRLDTRRVEAHTDLSVLDKENIQYKLLKTVTPAELSIKGVAIAGIGRLRLGSDTDQYSATYELAPEQDEPRLKLLLKKTAIAHVAVIALVLIASLFVKKETPYQEPQLVTIITPKKRSCERSPPKSSSRREKNRSAQN